MCLRTFITLLALFGALRAQASTLRGVVIANELGGPGVPNVRVSAVEGANPTVTKANGTFILEFPRKRPGDTIQLIVEKEGYVVVNDIQLEQVLPTEAAAKPLTIVLCRGPDRQEMARRFYRLKSLEAIEESYRKRLKELEEKQRASVAAMEQLARERDEARSAADRAANQLAKGEPGRASELYRQAMRLFLDGRIQEAINVLRDEELNRQLAGARGRKAEAESEIKAAARGWMLRGQLLTLQFQFNEAERAFRAAVEASPEDFAANFALGVFAQQLNRHDEARAAYGRCLELARREGSDPELADTLDNLAGLDYQQGRMQEALQEFDEALAIHRRSAEKGPDRYLPDVAMTLHDLGALYRDERRPDQARQDDEEALHIRRRLAGKNPNLFLPDLAITLNNLGNLDRDQRRYKEARSAYDEALNIARQLAGKNPQTYLHDVARTLVSLGNLDYEQHRNQEARGDFEEALSIDRQLAQKNPERYLPDMAMTLNDLGNVDHDLGILRHDQELVAEAREHLEEALRIRQQLAEREPRTYRPDLAMTLNNLGTLCSDLGYTESRQALDEALGIYRRLADEDPDAHLPDVAMTLNNLGNLNRREGRTAEAQQDYEQALAIRRGLARKNPEAFLPDLAQSLDCFGALYWDQGQFEEARRSFHDAVDAYRQLSLNDPEAYRVRLAMGLETLGDADRRLDRTQEAAQAYHDALETYQILAQQDPKRFGPQVTRLTDLLKTLAK
jgi:tetratricopeptide (TPR) repeat protein